MLGHQWLRYGVVVCLLLASAELWAGNPGVGRAAGMLAVQAGPEAEWRVISAGGILPDAGEARTAATGPAHLQAEQGTLSLGSLSQVTYHLTARRVELLTGRCFCAASGEMAWTVTAAGMKVEVPAGSGVEISVDSQGTVGVTTLRGSAVVQPLKVPAVTLTEKTTHTWRGALTIHETKPIDPAAEQRLLAWTKQLPAGQGVGQLVIKDAQSGARTRLNIARYHAEMVLQPPVALVKLDQTFYNPSDRQEEGEFLFNLPPGASVSRFAMFVTPEQLIEGEVIERSRANQIYTTIVSGRRDPAILEQVGDNLFRMRVFPIFAKDVKRILLDFTLPLEGHAGQFQVRLPLLSDLKPIWDFRLFGTLRGPTPLGSVQSSTFPDVKFAAQGPDEIGFDFGKANFQPNSDFLLSFNQPVPESPSTFRHLTAAPLSLTDDANTRGQTAHFNELGDIQSGLDDWNTTPATYFLADLPTPAATPAATAPADVLVLIDTSANGTLNQVRPALQTVLASLRDQDTFRLVCVDVVARPLHSSWLVPRSDLAPGAYRNFEGEFCMGGTDMLAACQSVESLYEDRPAGRRRVVMYLGDGIDSVHRQQRRNLHEECAAAIAKAGATLFAINTAQTPFAAIQRVETNNLQRGRNRTGGGFFQFGPDRSNNGNAAEAADLANLADGRLFLQRLTAAAGGRSFDFAAHTAERSQLFEWLLAGFPLPVRIQNLKVAGAALVDVYAPTNVLPGESFRVTGRVKTPGPLNITYSLAGAGVAVVERTAQLTPAANAADHLVGRYWAEQRLGQLSRILSARKDAGGNNDAQQMIVQLSREWSLLTPQTAFLVLETEEDYQRWRVPRQARRPYWSKDGLAPIAPLPREWLAEISERRTTQPFSQRKQTDEEFQKAQYALAKADLAAGNYERALRALDLLRGDPKVERAPEYVALRQQATQLQRDSRAVRGLGIKQAWFDFAHPTTALPVELDRLFATATPTTEFLLERHPLADALLREIDIPDKEMTVTEFARYLNKTLGIHVVVDSEKLEEESIQKAVKLPRVPLKRISALQAIRFQLDPLNLTIVEEPRSLIITTKTEAIGKHQRALFSIQDLVGSRPRFEFEDLLDPIADRNDAVQQRVEAKLDRPVTWKFADESLDFTVAKLRNELDENIVLDTVKLEEESIAPDATDIDIECENLPLRDVLREILNKKNLTYVVDGEVLRITTKPDNIWYRPLKLYPVSGLVFRDTRSDKRPVERSNRQFRGGWSGMLGGFGVGGFGGGGFGGGGVMGGGGVGPIPGGGGFGGGVAFDGTGDISEVFGPIDDHNLPPEPIEHTAPPELEPSDLELTDDGPQSRGRRVADADDLITILESQTGGPPDSPWMSSDGEGGDIVFFGPSMVLGIRQTDQAHEQIEALLQKQRKMLARRGQHPDTVSVTPWELINDKDSDAEVDTLIDGIMSLTGGVPNAPWVDLDGDGGVISYDKPRYALAVMQNPTALDEINSLLVKLRRERYALLHQSRPWTADLMPAAQLGLISGPWLTPLTPIAEPAGKVTTDKVEALKVRRELGAGRWRWLENARPGRSAFTLQTVGDRLRVNWPGWEIRVQGGEASVTMPELKYAEIGSWGQSLREWLDVELVFWPHRTNSELAGMFDISTVSDKPGTDPNQVHLRFVPAHFIERQVCLEIVYDKSTGLPVTWEAFQLGRLAQRGRFQPELDANKNLVRMNVQQESATGEVVAQGEWTSDPSQKGPIPAPDAVAEGTILLDRRPVVKTTSSGFERGLQSLRLRQFKVAVSEFRKAQERHPSHPLVNFLLAWSLDNQFGEVPSAELTQAYTKSTEVAPVELLRFLARHGSRQLTRREIYSLLNARLAATNQAQDRLLLAKMMLQDNSPGEALGHASAARKLPAASEAQQFEVLQVLIEASLRTGDFKSAIQHFDEWNRGKIRDWAQVSELLGGFEYYEHGAQIIPQYAALLQRKEAPLAAEMRRSVLSRYADAVKGPERWEKLLEAIELLPAKSNRANVELSLLLAELTRTGDVNNVVRLLERVHDQGHRQRLLALQAELTRDANAAQEMNWALYQRGYAFPDRLAAICDQFNATQHPERTVQLLEGIARKARLNHSERMRLATAYEMLNRPLDVIRAASNLE